MMLASARTLGAKWAGCPAVRVERFLSSSAHRLYPSSTMDLVDMEEGSSVQAGIHSTWQYVVNEDFCPATLRVSKDSQRDSSQGFWDKLAETNATMRKDSHVVACEVNFIEAIERRSSFDKILLLTKHCDHTVATGSVVTEPSLTSEGSGQALCLARRISTFCNDETRFLPELILVAPLRRAIQTALLSFAQFSPHTVRSVPWVCHPSATGTNYDVQDLLQLQTEFTGLEYTPCYQEAAEAVRADLDANSAMAILQRANAVLNWIRSRDEKIIVVSTENSFLQAFGCATNYIGASKSFRDGELRLLGLKFI